MGAFRRLADYTKNEAFSDLALSVSDRPRHQVRPHGVPAARASSHSAVIVHGNTITMEEFGHWLTPAHIMDGWWWKLPGHA